MDLLAFLRQKLVALVPLERFLVRFAVLFGSLFLLLATQHLLEYFGRMQWIELEGYRLLQSTLDRSSSRPDPRVSWGCPRV